MKYKALICDVDGTLIPNTMTGEPSERVKHAIKQAKEKIRIGIATARSFPQANYLIEEFVLNAPCIITSGAQMYDPVQKIFYSEKLLSLQQVWQIYALAREMEVELIIADMFGESPLTTNYQPNKPFDVYTKPLPEKKGDVFMRRVSLLKNLSVHKTLSREGHDLVHITVAHPEATKQHGILAIAEFLKISTHEIIGIGEGYNDFPLLMACGLKVAMGNAVEDVKAIADYIAPTVEEDGVADVIEKFVL